jgi:hypothetical protein
VLAPLGVVEPELSPATGITLRLPDQGREIVGRHAGMVRENKICPYEQTQHLLVEHRLRAIDDQFSEGGRLRFAVAKAR